MSQEELIKYRVARANETFEEARLLAEAGYWNAAANRLYYACFYLVNALLISRKLSYSSHNGVKTEFNRVFVKSGLSAWNQGNAMPGCLTCVRKVIILISSDLRNKISIHFLKKFKRSFLK